MKKVLLTGATGLIGKEAIYPLESAGFEVFALSSMVCNILDIEGMKKIFEKYQPEYLLHFAWVTGGDYLENPINEDFVEASFAMLKAFKENGGKRAVYAGTCFEYEFRNEKLKETDPVNPISLYAKSKNTLRIKAEKLALDLDISFAWGRIFYVYGHDEKEGRLTSYILDCLQKDLEIHINCGQLIRDYMHSKEIARAFTMLLESNVQGTVNISTGKGISLEEFTNTFARKQEKLHLVKIKNEESNQPPIIIGNNDRLIYEVKFIPEQLQ